MHACSGLLFHEMWCRQVKPYWFDFVCGVKGRHAGQNVIDLFSQVRTSLEQYPACCTPDTPRMLLKQNCLVAHCHDCLWTGFFDFFSSPCLSRSAGVPSVVSRVLRGGFCGRPIAPGGWRESAPRALHHAPHGACLLKCPRDLN